VKDETLVPDNEDLRRLWLLQLADSALPVGAAAHSFGLETLVERKLLTVELLEPFLRCYLREVGFQDGAFCRAAHRLAAESVATGVAFRTQSWLDLNRQLSARKQARESRAASAALGRRFLQLLCELQPEAMLAEVMRAAKQGGVDTHSCTVFGLSGGVLKLGDETTAHAYLHQSLSGLVSACQRLLPLGQTQAQNILWRLKPAIIETAGLSRNVECEEAYCFAPLLELGAMCHPYLETRLFIS